MPYIPNRVYLKDYASLPADSPLLVPLPTARGHKQQYIHHLVLPDFMEMSIATNAQIGVPLSAASGWRDCLWPSFAAYKKAVIKQYGSLEKGQKYRAFQSPHQTGLCIDLLCGGLAPVSATIKDQKQSWLFRWLVENMWRWGFTPYLAEPWHIEHKVDPASYWAGTVQNKAFAFEDVTTCSDENDVCEAPHDWVMV
jgi:hypothetical protein